jgi:hypothetical protein
MLDSHQMSVERRVPVAPNFSRISNARTRHPQKRLRRCCGTTRVSDGRPGGQHSRRFCPFECEPSEIVPTQGRTNSNRRQCFATDASRPQTPDAYRDAVGVVARFRSSVIARLTFITPSAQRAYRSLRSRKAVFDWNPRKRQRPALKVKHWLRSSMLVTPWRDHPPQQ